MSPHTKHHPQRWRNRRLVITSLFAFLILALSFTFTNSVQAQATDFPFGSSGLFGEVSNNPTSLQFGPDNRLYVSQQNGTIYAYTIVRNNAAPGDGAYSVTNTETINIIKNNVQNHNDDGSVIINQQRQVTGILVAGTATNPVLYVTSSDWRIAVSQDSGLDTNSGTLTRLTWNGSQWERVDLVRGLARSEENHSTNGMAIDPNTNTLYVMSGGHANKGAPSNNLSGTPEYWTSAAMLSVDLDALEAMPIYTDSRTNTQFIYDLPTLDDPTRANVLGSANGYPASHPLYNEMVDPGDPFGGNNGLNMAFTIPGNPVQIYSPGYRNAYDVVYTEEGRLYTWDNGPNGGWGGLPVLRDSNDNLVNYTTEANYATAFQPQNGVYCTNELYENVSNGHGDVLAFVTGEGYYGGHPAPIRAFPSRSGIYAYAEQGDNNWVQIGPDYSFEALMPAYVTNLTGYDFDAWFPDNPVECTYTSNDPNRYLSIINASTNGLTEYTASNFEGDLRGDLLVASFNGTISRVDLDETGDASPNSDTYTLFSNFGSQPLDVTAQGDDDIFPGTVWAATYGADNITVFEPTDYGECEGLDDASLDEDFDGYDNADEIASGTSPCNGGSTPPDRDNDFESDLLDTDDDNDGILDVVDAFQIDPDNGLTTHLPINYPFQNNDPGTGFFGVGFTGLMTNGTTDYLDQYDPEDLTIGGAGGKFTVDVISTGDAFEDVNNQDYAFQMGVNVDTNSEPFTIHTSLETPYFVDLNGTQSNPENYESYGLYMGTGDQDNYLKVVLRGNGGTNGLQVLLETDSNTSQNNYNVANILNAGAIDLYFIVDPANLTAQPAYSINGGGTVNSLGSPIGIPAAWLDPNDDQGLAVGLISTSTGGSNRAVGGSWDFVTVLASGPAVDDPIEDVEVMKNSAPTVFPLNNVFVDDGGLSNLTFSVSNVSNPALFNPQPSIGQSGDQFLLTLSYAPDAIGTSNVTIMATDADQMTETETFTVTVLDEAPVLYRLNTGGPTIPSIDDGPDWITDTSGEGATYLIEGGTTTYSASAGGAYPGPIVMTHPSLPEGVPPEIFNMERYDASAAPEMTYAFPAIAGSQATVRLYFAEIFGGVPDSSGQRIFDVQVEGNIPPVFDDINPFSVAGAKGAMMLEAEITVGQDGDIDLVFIHDSENPAIKGIEILGVINSNVDEPPVVNAFGTLTHYEGDTPDLYVDASDDGASLTFGATGLPTGLDMETTNGHIFGTIADGAAANSPYDVTISVDDGVNVPVEFTFTWNVLDPDVAGTILYRVNSGGPQVAAIDGGPAWSEDQVTTGAGGTAGTGTPSPYVNGTATNDSFGTSDTVTLSSSVPAGVPAAIFQTERWDDTTAPEMLWEFPVANGTTVEVRLYFAEIFDTTSVVGGRVFDVSVEGSVPASFENIDPYVLAGEQHDVGVMVSHTVEITDGALNLEFVHGTENPSVKAIEIVDVTAGGNQAPTVLNPLPDITILENENIAAINLLDPQVFEDDVDGAPYLIYAASSDNQALVTANVSSTTLNLTVTADSTGTATITVTAEDSDGAIGQDTFVVTVNPDTTDNPPFVEIEIPDVTVDQNAAPVVVDLAVAFEDDVTLDADLSYSVMGNSNLPLIDTSITDTELTLTFETDMFGTAEIEVKAEDELGQSITDTFMVTVNEILDNYPPVTENGGIPDQTVDEDAAPIVIDLAQYFVDDQDADVDLDFSVVGNSNFPLVSTGINGSDLTLTIAADMFGTADISVTATDTEGATSAPDTFVLTVNEFIPQNVVLYRVNNGGPQLTDSPINWEEDQAANASDAGQDANPGTPSQYLVNPEAGDTTFGPSGFTITNNTGAPDNLFAHERFSDALNPNNMQWEFPVPQNGWYQVNLYFAEGWTGAQNPGVRVFDIQIEGTTVLDNYDVVVAAGGLNIAVAETVYVEMTDGMLDLDFIQIAQNPAIKGIEIVQLGAPPANMPPVLDTPLEDLEVEIDSADTIINLDDYFSDPESLPLTYGVNVTSSNPSGLVSASVVDSTLTLSYVPGETGVAVLAVSATDSEALSTSDTFSVSVIEEVDEQEVFFRVNAGGPELPAADGSSPVWAVDTNTTPSPYRVAGSTNIASSTDAINMSDPSVAGGPAPAALFQTERWDAPAAPQMQWEFPIPSGTEVEVRLYFAETYNAVVLREFNVSVEGNVPAQLTAINPTAIAGADGAFMRSVVVTSDGMIDIDFVHINDNPAIKAIEILEAPTGNTAPVVINPIDDISVEENGTIAVIDVSSVFDDADLPTDTLTLSVLSSDPTLVDAVLNGTDLTLTLGTDESGVAAITVTATDEANASATDTFIVTVTPPDVVNTAPTVLDPIDDVVEAFGATSNSISLTGVFTDPEQDDSTLVLDLLGISNLTLFDDVTINGSSLDLTYVTGVSGTANITLRATDNGGLTATNTFTVTIQPDDTPGNNPPTVENPIPDVINEVNTVTSDVLDLSDVFADVEDDAVPTPLTLVVLSNSNLGLVDASISGTDLTLNYTADVVSSATLTVRAFDSAGDFVDDSFVVTITAPANTPPTVANPLTDPTLFPLGAEQNLISLTGLFTDAEQDASTLDLEVTDVSNPALITNAEVINGDDLFLTYGGIVGESTVTITATDDEQASTPFTFTIEVFSTDTDILAVKTAPQSALVGDQFTYEINVTNNGPSTAQDVKITDILPGGVQFVSFNPAEPICTEANDVVICTIAQIGVNNTETIQITVEAVSASQFYTISATNSAPFTVPNLSLTHSLPDGVTFASVTPSDQCVYNENANTITCNFGATAPGVTKYATVEVTTNEPSIITNQAIVSADNADTITSNQAITTIESPANILDASALVEITPGAGLGASTFSGSSFQITNNSGTGINITSVSIDFSTGILPDMVFDPVGAGGDATSSCFTPNSGGAATGVIAPSDPCVDPYSVPRNGGFDVMTVNFADFGPGEFFAFTTDVDPNSIQGVSGAGDAGAVSGYELIGATVTVTFIDGTTEQTLISSLYEDGSLGGAQAVVENGAPATPTISLLGYPTTPVTVNAPNQIVQVTGTPGADVSLLLMDTRLYIATGAPPFDVTSEELPYYANEAMSGKTLYAGVIPPGGTLNIPVTLLQTLSGNATPDGGLNHIVAVLTEEPYAVDQPVSQTSNILVVKYEPDTSETVGSAELLINNNGSIFATTFNANSFVLNNTGDSDIVSVTMNIGSSYLPDVVFDPVGNGGDSGAKCFTADGNAVAVGLTTASPACGAPPYSLPSPTQPGDTDPNTGYFELTLEYNDFNPGESFSFSTDMDPTSIKGDSSTGDAGAISGMETIGGTVTVTFADGGVITAPIWLDATQSNGGGRAVVAPTTLTAPSIEISGLVTPTVTNIQNHTVIVTGTPNTPFTLLQVDARLYIDAGGGGYDIDPFEANEALSKVIYTGTLNGAGTATVAVSLLQTASPNAGPDAGINHFIAVLNGADNVVSAASEVLVVEYDPNFTGPALVITPNTMTFTAQPDVTTGDTFVVSTSDASNVTGVALTAEDSTFNTPAWLTIPATTNTGVTQNLTIDTTGLSEGVYTATVTASANGYAPAALNITLTVGTISTEAICINAGGPAYTTVADSFFPAGIQFLADSANVSPWFDSGSKSTFTNPNINLTNSSNLPLFTTERSATGNLVPFNFALDVDPGQYLVQMYFADIYFGATGGGNRNPNDGQRVFDLTIEPGTANAVLLLDNYDINADVGPETVVLHQGIFTVSDGELNINFTPSVDQAKISALCVTPITGGGNIAPTINPIADATISEGETFSTTVSAFDSEIVALSATVEDANSNPVSATFTDNGNNTGSLSIPTTSGDAGDVYTVTITADDSVNPVATEIFLVYVVPVSDNNPSVEILITDGVTDNLNSWNDVSTFGANAFTIENTGDVNITSVAFNVSTTYMPDLVFDPVAHGGDTISKCFDANNGASAVGLVTADGACGAPPFGLPNLDQQAGDPDPDAGYFGLTLTFNNFNPNETFGFSVDMDPSSIKGDNTAGGSGGISGMELIGGTVTVTFEDGTVITAPVWLDGVQSNAGGRAIIGQFAPSAPSISMIGLTTPTTTNIQNQTVQITGTPNAPFTLLQVDGRLHLDSGSGNGPYPNGYDIDPYEANESIGKTVYSGTLNASGVANVPLNLMLTTQTYGGPNGGINHFIAVINGTNGQTSGTSNVLVVEYDPEFGGGNNLPPEVTNPGTQNSVAGVPITPLSMSATAPESGQTLAFSATGLPQGLSINPSTGVISGTPTCPVVGGTGAFQESQAGLFSVEVESVPPTGDWTIETEVNGASGDYYEWQHGSTNAGTINPGQGILSYPVEIETPGRYRFLWRTAAPNDTEHNDTWVRVTGAGSDAVGVQGGDEIQIGNGQGWIKVYQNSSNDNWVWVANTVDDDAHQIFFDFATAGVYTVEFSARSTLHKLDRWVLYNNSYSQSQATNLNVPVSQRSGATGGDDNCTYNVEVTVIDNGVPVGVTTVNFQWNVTEDGSGGGDEPAVVSYTLINAVTNTEIGELVNGAVLNLATLPAAINIRANTNPPTVDSVTFTLTGAENHGQTEGGAPYSLFGDSGGNYDDWVPTIGAYNLSAVASEGGDNSAPYQITFTVINDDDEDLTPIANAGTYPNPIPESNGAAGESVVLNGSASVDPDNTVGTGIVTYNWTINGNPLGQNTATPSVSLNDGANTVSLIVIDDEGTSSTPANVVINVEPYVPVGGTCGGITVEAEDGELSGTFVIGNDANASGGQYVHAPQLSGNSSVPTNNNHVTLCFTVPQAGTYQMIGWVWANDSGSDSFFVNIDGESYIWDVLMNTAYEQDYVAGRGVGNPLQVNLPAGEVEIIFILREDGARLDKIQLELVGGPPANLPPTANAGSYGTVADTDGQPGETIELDGTASSDPDGNIVTYNWTVNSTPLGQNTATPSVNLNDGVNTISLVVTDDDGASSTSSSTTITVTAPVPNNQAPTANAGSYGTIEDSDGQPGESIELDGTGSSDPDGNIVTYNWTVNSTPLGQNTATPSVNLNDGVNTISLVVTDDDGASSAPSSTTITVEAPDVTPTCGPLVQEAEDGTLAGNFTTASGNNASGGEYILTPNGSGNSNGSPSTTTTATYCFTVPQTGTYQITGQISGKSQGNTFWVQVLGNNYLWDLPLTTAFVQDYVNNRNGADPVQLNLTAGQQLTVVITVREDGAWLDTIGLELVGGQPTNLPPTANVGSYGTVADTNGQPGESFTLNGSGSSDPDGTIVTYSWTVNSIPLGQNTANPSVSLNDGVNTVSLVVTDDDGASSAPSATTITVTAPTPQNQAPTANAGSYGTVADTNGQPGEPFTLNGSGSNDPDGTITTYNWTVNSTPLGQNTANPSVNLNDGANSVSLIVIDDNGASSAPSSTTINVSAPSTGGQAVVSFTLINSLTDTAIGTLSNNDVLNLDTLPAGINIAANTSPATVGSVVMTLSGTVNDTQTESGAPYALFSDNAGNYFDWAPVAGSYTLTATPYSGNNGSGTAGTPLTINFTIQAGGQPPAGDLITNIQVANGKIYQNDTLAIGELIYIDRAYLFTNVPPSLAGEEFIRVSNDDKTISNPNFLTFTLTADATVYVAWDSRAPAPSWLSSWTLTGLTLVGQDHQNTTLARVVYSQNFAAGQVTLPASGFSSSGTSYTVIAEPQGASAQSVTIPNMGAREVPPVNGTSNPITPVDSNGIILIPPPSGAPQTDENGIIIIPLPNGG